MFWQFIINFHSSFHYSLFFLRLLCARESLELSSFRSSPCVFSELSSVRSSSLSPCSVFLYLGTLHDQDKMTPVLTLIAHVFSNYEIKVQFSGFLLQNTYVYFSQCTMYNVHIMNISVSILLVCPCWGRKVNIIVVAYFPTGCRKYITYS